MKIIATIIVCTSIGLLGGFYGGLYHAEKESGKRLLEYDSRTEELQSHIAVTEIEFMLDGYQLAKRNKKRDFDQNICFQLKLKLGEFDNVSRKKFDSKERAVIEKAEKQISEIGCG